MGLAARIERLIEPTIEAMGLELVRVLVEGRNRVRLQVMVDRRDGRPVAVDDCVRVSRAISALLDAEDPIAGSYTLEVSSPGLDRPLVKEQDYDRFQGREASLELVEPVDGRRRFKGRLLGRDGDAVRIEVDGIARDVRLADIHRAHLVFAASASSKAEGETRS